MREVSNYWKKGYITNFFQKDRKEGVFKDKKTPSGFIDSHSLKNSKHNKTKPKTPKNKQTYVHKHTNLSQVSVSWILHPIFLLEKPTWSTRWNASITTWVSTLMPFGLSRQKCYIPCTENPWQKYFLQTSLMEALLTSLHISWSSSQAPYSQLEVTVLRWFQKMKPMVVHDGVTVDFKCIDTFKGVTK